MFLVYFFVSTAVLSQYASTMNSIHEVDIFGVNPYFPNTSSERLIVKKADESNFTENDLREIAAALDCEFEAAFRMRDTNERI